LVGAGWDKFIKKGKLLPGLFFFDNSEHCPQNAQSGKNYGLQNILFEGHTINNFQLPVPGCE
jgi:hypothetical protein